MRGWVLLLVLASLAVGLWLALRSGAEPDLDPPEASAGAGTGPTGPEDPLTGARAHLPDKQARKRPGGPAAFAVPVTVAALLEDRDGSTQRPLPHFALRLTDGSGKVLLEQTVESAAGTHTLQLGVGAYALAATREGLVPPAPARFTITRESAPVSLTLPFRAIEAVLLLEVLDQSTKRRLQQYRVSVATHRAGQARPETTFVSAPESNPLPIHAARGQRLVVRVEAPGYAPAAPVEVAFDGTVDRVEKQVFLAAAMRFTGVEWTVTDAAEKPVRHLLVAAEIRQSDGTYRALWQRRAADDKGVYKLPDLGPGAYRMELRSVDEHGLSTLHLPRTVEFELTGTEHIRDTVVLPAGAGIELALTDLQGTPIGAGVTIALTHPDGEVHESVWRALETDGRPDANTPLTADHLVKAAPARLHRCVTPGRYSIALQLGQGPKIVRTLHLEAAKLTRVKAQLSR